ncbi:hypothetical protein OIE62_41025 (plasmid) [Streptomyces scopuliridis]|uniref:Uncharacterized protein n=1 Tax=Streptomyces scopuliridis TaxID=452529 RepID=A0ACD4ZZ80_9ACTN|nr:hypothetical protein [Streptomyces scopuliridis]WSC03550.1 hypothetical protein OG835_42470 [Streptomyces scopuliridis]WSC11306.1 hypothetical protein OIE62_41025 [Streptomyces scopuliridis]
MRHEQPGPAGAGERTGPRRLETDPRTALVVGEIDHGLAVQDHPGRQTHGRRHGQVHPERGDVAAGPGPQPHTVLGPPQHRPMAVDSSRGERAVSFGRGGRLRAVLDGGIVF